MPHCCNSERRGCGICDNSNRANLACPSCINNTLLYEKRKVLQELCLKRDGILLRLTNLLGQRELYQSQQYQRQQKAVTAKAAKQQAAHVKEELEAAKQKVAALRNSNASRRARLERLTAHLSSVRTENLAHQLPTLLRYQSLTLSHVSAMLLREQRLKLQQLLDILPLRISSIRSAGSATIGAAVQATVAGLKLPDTQSVLPLMLQQPEATSSALGYVVLLLDLMSTYLGGPLLHEGSFQGSTSVLWQQSSFWNRRPASHNARLPLFLEDSSGAAPLAMANPFPGLTNKVRGGGTWGGLSRTSNANEQTPSSSSPASLQTLSRNSSRNGRPENGNPMGTGTGSGTMGGVGAGSGVNGSSNGNGSAYSQQSQEALLLRQRHSDLRAAFDMLQRSASCFVRDKAHVLSLQLPPSWSPFGWLVLLAAEVRKDARSAGVLATASSMLGGVGPGNGPGSLDGADGFMLDLPGDGDYDDDEEEDVDGWGVVRAPYLPPPPSQPEAVEHWSRAMFTDAALSPQPVRQASSNPLSLERVRSLFSRS